MTAVKSAQRDKRKLAVELALAGSWDEAAEMNREVIRESPGDVEAYNRLAKALTELGALDEAVSAFEGALAISPQNPIARRNLDRLNSRRNGGSGAALRAPAGSSRRSQLTAETGKSAVVPLVSVAAQTAVTGLMPGDEVELVNAGSMLRAVAGGVRIGQVEPRQGARILRLMAGGNRYEASIKAIGDGEISLLIRETYKHPSQISVVSFPNPETDRRALLDSVQYLPAELAQAARDREVALSLLKDWSSDDTEPGDDQSFTPEVHRVINSTSDSDDIF